MGGFRGGQPPKQFSDVPSLRPTQTEYNSQRQSRVSEKGTHNPQRQTTNLQNTQTNTSKTHTHTKSGGLFGHLTIACSSPPSCHQAVHCQLPRETRHALAIESQRPFTRSYQNKRTWANPPCLDQRLLAILTEPLSVCLPVCLLARACLSVVCLPACLPLPVCLPVPVCLSFCAYVRTRFVPLERAFSPNTSSW